MHIVEASLKKFKILKTGSQKFYLDWSRKFNILSEMNSHWKVDVYWNKFVIKFSSFWQAHLMDCNYSILGNSFCYHLFNGSLSFSLSLFLLILKLPYWTLTFMIKICMRSFLLFSYLNSFFLSFFLSYFLCYVLSTFFLYLIWNPGEHRTIFIQQKLFSLC